MPETTVANPLVGKLLDCNEVVEAAAKLKSLELDSHHYLNLGSFPMDAELLEAFKHHSGCFRHNFDREYHTLSLAYGSLPWELRWRHGGNVPTINVFAVLRLNEKEKMVEAVACSEVNGGGRLSASLPPNRSIYPHEFMERQSHILRPICELHPERGLLRQLHSQGRVKIADFAELPWGQLKTVGGLFHEFSGDRELRRKLADSGFTPFEPKGVWGLYAPENVWPMLLDGWKTQLRKFKRDL